MKKIYSYISLILAAGFINSCVEENLEQVNPSYREGEVIFSAVSGFETGDKDTKTVYSGDTYTIDGKTYERIEWETGDKIKIYCHTGNNKQAADYSVGTATTSSDHIHTAVLNKHDEDNGIHWNGTDEHRFYAIYPSPTMPNTSDSKTDLEGRVDITYDESTETAILQGYVPTTQAPIAIVDDKAITNNGTLKRTADYWAKPDMRYSYMVASTTATPSANGTSGVNLSFSAVATALEIDIVAPLKTTISEVIIQSKSGAPLTGNFTCPIDKEGKPKTNEIKITGGASTVNIQLGACAMEANETLRITALLLPVNVSEGDLNIIVQTDQLMRGNLGGVSLMAHKKHYLTNIRLKTDVQGNNWITMLPDDALIKGLSIPATSNSFSYYLASKNINNSFTGTLSSEQDRYITQIKSFDDQWNMGVRCFEFVSDRNSSTTSTANIGAQDLRCNSTSLGIDFRTAFEKIVSKVAGTDEFAMVICTYQPEGKSGNARNPQAYMTQLRNFYNEQKNRGVKMILYQPGVDVGFAAGTIMLVARPSQEGEDSDAVVNAAVAGNEYNILTVKGWGSLPDKWWRRGYEAMLFRGADQNGERIDMREGISVEVDDNGNVTKRILPAMESWIYGDSGYGQINSSYYEYAPYATGDKLTENLPEKGTQRYAYSTDVIVDGRNFEVWAQEWRRVFKDAFNKTGDLGSNYNYSYIFFSSVAEKKDDILYTFEKSIADISGNYVYFNSLSSYYVIDDVYKSFAPYWMGNIGKIGECATEMNTYLDGVIESKGEANITGPMGVVIMDRVGETQASIDLAKIIIANNFKFTLQTSTKHHAGSAEVEDWVDESLN